MTSMTSSSAHRPSFLETVLTNAGQVEMFDLKERMQEVTLNISQLKIRVDGYMKSKYIDFDPLMKKTKGFLSKAVRTSDDINSLFNRIEVQTKCDLVNSTGELRNLHASLKESSAVLAVTTELLQMDGAMKDVEDSCKEGKFLDAANSLQSLREFLRNSSQETKQLQIYKSITNEVIALTDTFCSQNADKLDSFITWESTDMANSFVKSTIKIQSSSFKEMQEVAQALHLLDELLPWMKKLRHFLLRSILLPLINNEASITFDSELNVPYSSMEVGLKQNSGKPNCLVTLDNLTKCFEFLHGELDMQFENGDSFLSLLGSGVSQEFCDNLIKNCLKETVPSTSAELQNISGVQERTASFNNYMIGIGFLPEENHSLMEYVQNYEALCASKACENYLKKAREIMKEDLQDMIEVRPQFPTTPLNSTLSSEIDLTGYNQSSFSNIALKSETELNPNLFQFPSCYVSKSTIKILDLVDTILGEASKVPDGGSPQFYLSTTKAIFELYILITPNVHEKLLNSIPQQVALFHNNCMYLAHRLVVLGFEVEASFRSLSRTGTIVTFVDLVQDLRVLGTSVFLKHMQTQRKQMLDVVKGSGLATLGENSELNSDTERSLRQCLRQLELLQAIWQNVLPCDVYSKSIGVLANALLDELIVRVTSVEDIPANTAVQLISHFKLVQERIPQLFKSDEKIISVVKRWQKFQELINILGASLRDIETRWDDGKGPLAKEFSVEQVKQLIRALFQNTKRRADVLAKIR